MHLPTAQRLRHRLRRGREVGRPRWEAWKCCAGDEGGEARPGQGLREAWLEVAATRPGIYYFVLCTLYAHRPPTPLHDRNLKRCGTAEAANRLWSLDVPWRLKSNQTLKGQAFDLAEDARCWSLSTWSCKPSASQRPNTPTTND